MNLSSNSRNYRSVGLCVGLFRGAGSPSPRQTGGPPLHRVSLEAIANDCIFGIMGATVLK
jgi:hypothetical protein